MRRVSPGEYVNGWVMRNQHFVRFSNCNVRDKPWEPLAVLENDPEYVEILVPIDAGYEALGHADRENLRRSFGVVWRDWLRTGAPGVDPYYDHPDHLGSSSYVTDPDGEIVQHLQCFLFGETLVEEHSNTPPTPYLFTAKELDEETGLYDLGALLFRNHSNAKRLSKVCISVPIPQRLRTPGTSWMVRAGPKPEVASVRSEGFRGHAETSR